MSAQDKRPDDVTVSKLLSLVLRHDPARIGLALDGAGWASVEELLACLRAEGVVIDRPFLDHLVETNPKRRFAFSEDGTRIRASQGHSIEVDLGLPPMVPPAVLYHGTASRSLEAIRAEGLKAMERQHVHLSPDEATATAVGSRHGKPVVLTVKSGEMHRDGFVFFHSANGVWLVESVPAGYIAPLEGWVRRE